MAHLLGYHNPYRIQPITPSISHPRFILPHRSQKIVASAHRRRAILIGVMKSLPGVDDAELSKGIVKATNSGPVGSSGPKIPLPHIPVWARWVLGAIICVSIPFYKKILRIEDAIEKVAEATVETIGKAAEVTEKIAGDIADALPAGGKLKEKIQEVEHIAGVAKDNAEIADTIIHKIDEVTDEIELIANPIDKEGEVVVEEIIVKEEVQEEKVDSPNTASINVEGEVVVKEIKVKEVQEGKVDNPNTVSSEAS